MHGLRLQPVSLHLCYPAQGECRGGPESEAGMAAGSAPAGTGCLFSGRLGVDPFLLPIQEHRTNGPLFSVSLRKREVLRVALGDSPLLCSPQLGSFWVEELTRGLGFPQRPEPSPWAFTPSSPGHSCPSCVPCATAQTCTSPGWPRGGDTQSHSAGSSPGGGQTDMGAGGEVGWVPQQRGQGSE